MPARGVAGSSVAHQWHLTPARCVAGASAPMLVERQKRPRSPPSLQPGGRRGARPQSGAEGRGPRLDAEPDARLKGGARRPSCSPPPRRCATGRDHRHVAATIPSSSARTSETLAPSWLGLKVGTARPRQAARPFPAVRPDRTLEANERSTSCGRSTEGAGSIASGVPLPEHAGGEERARPLGGVRASRADHRWPSEGRDSAHSPEGARDPLGWLIAPTTCG